MTSSDNKTIAAPATAAGSAGVAIIRVSGQRVNDVAYKLTRKKLTARVATCVKFFDSDGVVVDSGLCLYFAAPASYTGEDCLEIHCHGNDLVVKKIMSLLIFWGVELAGPGEFTKRAFLNGKMSLFQAEAVASIIEASSEAALKAASRSLSGAFSKEVDVVIKQLVSLRVMVEAGLDFSEEEIDFLTKDDLSKEINSIIKTVNLLQQRAKLGKVIQDGFKVVLTGPANAGKSSIFNFLSRTDDAIVTNIAGTTRDVLRQSIKIADGFAAVQLYDTAGIRDSNDAIEQEGILRSQRQLQESDCVLMVLAADSYTAGDFDAFASKALKNMDICDKVIFILNKEDLAPCCPNSLNNESYISVSAKTGEGMDSLLEVIATRLWQSPVLTEDLVIARARHVMALEAATQSLLSSLSSASLGLEIVAEHLKNAQDELGKITGAVSSDDLLGFIFGSFCIGK